MARPAPSHDGKEGYGRNRSVRDSPGQRPRSHRRQNSQGFSLSNDKRKAMLSEVQTVPGMNKNQIGDRLGFLPNLVEFHLQQLVKKDLVRTVESPQGRAVLCFAREDAHLWQEEATRVLFGREPVRLVALYIAHHPDCTSQEISDALDRSKVTVQHHLRTLRDRGLVERRRVGRSREYEPAQILTEWTRELAGVYNLPW